MERATDGRGHDGIGNVGSWVCTVDRVVHGSQRLTHVLLAVQLVGCREASARIMMVVVMVVAARVVRSHWGDG